MNTPAGSRGQANPVRSSAGDANRTDIGTSFLPPFMACTTRGLTTCTVLMEST